MTKDKVTKDNHKPLELLNSKITRLFRKACADYSLLEDGDRVLVALSGGKTR